MLDGLSHITLAVKDIDRSFDFYVNLLEMKPCVRWDYGAYLVLGDLWFCLSLDDEVATSTDYTHIAFAVAKDNFTDISERLLNADVTVWKENKSEGDSLYFLDPDGHKLEVHAGSLSSRLEALKKKSYPGLVWC
ncbi:fosfomycin resistance glutathione transferase [Motiliproteus sp. MSK22-1]|uniref:fosfomycin resistance glutathione transferase n=1 Tax=Motiliproteus sp. MSK22-1 TaxID=1897630 RepID=UPI000977D2D0|nr:fosfomycin resistance glutathione transferase [Motiliproteus sp. MSK22-1]OMH37992.1 hypothetical protein BGP75_06810 [Motiliproteus sp. MSK22-1]